MTTRSRIPNNVPRSTLARERPSRARTPDASPPRGKRLHNRPHRCSVSRRRSCDNCTPLAPRVRAGPNRRGTRGTPRASTPPSAHSPPSLPRRASATRAANTLRPPVRGPRPPRTRCLFHASPILERLRRRRSPAPVGGGGHGLVDSNAIERKDGPIVERIGISPFARAGSGHRICPFGGARGNE
jgi:hypothetical protein